MNKAPPQAYYVRYHGKSIRRHLPVPRRLVKNPYLSVKDIVFLFAPYMKRSGRTAAACASSDRKRIRRIDPRYLPVASGCVVREYSRAACRAAQCNRQIPTRIRSGI